MANQKISELVAVTDLQDADQYVLARAGVSQKITGASLKAGTLEPMAVVNPAALQAFWGGLGNCLYAPCDIMWIGDSRCEGQGTTAVERRRPSVFRDLLRQIHQVGGPVGGRGYVPSWYAFVSPAAQGPTLAGTASTNTTYGLGRRSAALPDATAILTYPAILCTSADLLYNNLLTGTKVSGLFDADAATINTSGATGGTTVFRVTPTAGRGSRVLKAAFGAASAATVQFEGAMFYDGDETTGIRLWDGSHYGFLTSSFTGLENWLSSVQRGPTAANLKLVTYVMGTNDCVAISSAVFKTNLLQLIADTKTKAPVAGTSHCIIALPDRTTTGTAHIEPWANYVAAMKSIAVADTTVAFLDLGPPRFPPADSDTFGFFNGDLIHENDKGHRTQAFAVARALAPR